MEWVSRRVLGEPVPADVPPGVSVRRSRWIPSVAGTLSGMGAPARAVTLGATILLHTDAELTPRLLRHELAHVRQWRASPALFPLRYLWGHLMNGYRMNPYEIEARAAEEEGASPPDGGHRRSR